MKYLKVMQCFKDAIALEQSNSSHYVKNVLNFIQNMRIFAFFLEKLRHFDNQFAFFI